jgi:sialic acid synthase SpsE
MNTASPIIKLGKKLINNLSKPFIIAEIGVNHEGSLSRAKKLILEAKNSGADVAKFQTYKAELIVSKSAKSYWDNKKERTRSQYDLFKKYDLFNEKEYIELYNYCKKVDIEFTSTPFDHNSVDILNPLVNFFKISSSDITNFPLLKKIASKKKPIILSTGASTITEIREAILILRKHGAKKIVIMHCILNYPTSYKNANLRMIVDLKNNFKDYIIGYSDHTLPDPYMTSLVAAYTLGAIVLEKHFTNNKNLKGNDHYHAMDKIDLLNFRDISNRIFLSLGSYASKNYIKTEKLSRLQARRSLITVGNLKKNQILRESNLICKRPGTGISPVHLFKVLGKKVSRNLKDDHILTWKDIK